MSSDSPVAILYDNTGNPIATTSTASQKNIATSAFQTTRISTANSRNTNLDPGVSFTGTGEATTGISSVHIMCNSDQVLEINIEQSTDNSNWDVQDTFLVYPGVSRGRVFQAVGNYFRVVATNISPTATTYLRLSAIMCPFSNALPRALTPGGTLPLCNSTVSYAPDVKNFSNVGDLPALQTDSEGHISIRGPILTDERSFRDDFTGSNIVFALSGTSTFDSVYVVGVSTSFLSEIDIGDYIKLDADPESALTIVKDVISDTLLILEEDYAGTPGTGATSKTRWYYQSGTGGTITFTTTEVQLNSGATPGGHSTLFRAGDYGPVALTFVAKLSNRRTNQEADVGMMDGPAYLSDKLSMVSFTGTDNTKVNFVTCSASTDKETTTVTLPNEGTTDTYHTYFIGVFSTEVYLCIDNIRVATHSTHIPGPYDVMDMAFGLANFGAVDGSSTMTVDTAFFCNFNSVEMRQQTGILEVVNSHPPFSTAGTNIPAAVASTLIAAANVARAGITIYNDSTAVLYLKLGSGASPTSYTVRMRSNDYYETPYGYTGKIYGYWEAANGAARVTEVY